MLAPDPVHPADERRQAVRPGQVPVPELVLLRIEVLLAPGRDRRVLAELERRPVDPVRRGEGGRQHEAQLERRMAAVLQELVQDVRRVRPHVRAEVLADRAAGQLREVVHQLVLRVAPREVRVRLAEAGLGQPVHHLGSGERLGQEQDVGMIGLDRADQPLPEREWLGVRVVDAQDPNALLDPEADHVGQALPQRRPVLGLEVERVDVLVFLGRVLGVLDTAVGALAEPCRVLAYPRMVG